MARTERTPWRRASQPRHTFALLEKIWDPMNGRRKIFVRKKPVIGRRRNRGLNGRCTLGIRVLVRTFSMVFTPVRKRPLPSVVMSPPLCRMMVRNNATGRCDDGIYPAGVHPGESTNAVRRRDERNQNELENPLQTVKNVRFQSRFVKIWSA